MTSRHRTILPYLILFFNFLVAFSETSEENSRNHLIIAVDQFTPYKHILTDRNYMLSRISEIVNPNGGEKLLNDDDYISMVTFGLGSENTDFSQFAKPSFSSGKPIAWMNFSGWSDIFNAWNTQVLDRDYMRFRGAHFSLLTAAKPFSLAALKSPADSVAADRTFLLMATDDHYAGYDNYQKEFTDYRINGGKASRKEFSDMLREYHSLFKESEIRRDTISRGMGKPYVLILLEIVPTTMPSLYSILDIPASLNLRRTPGGYAIDFNASTVDDMYRLRDVKVTVQTEEGPLTANSGESGEIGLFIPKGYIDSDNIKVSLDATVVQQDGIYNGMAASPLNPNTRRMHSDRILSAKGEGNIFGIAMPDAMWWWCRDDIAKAAFIWEVVLVLILILVVVVIVGIINKKTTVYIPTNEEMGIRAIFISQDAGSSKNKGMEKKKKTEVTEL